MRKKVLTLLLISTSVFSCPSCASSEHVHTFDMGVWEYNEYYHWHPSTCGHQYAVEKTSHRFSKMVIAPTVDEQGYTTHTCSDCGYSYSDSWTYPLSETQFSVNWKNDDGKLLRSDLFLYGSLPEYKDRTPVKSGDTNGDYVFTGWTPEIHKVTSDQEYTAQYRLKDKLPTVYERDNCKYMFIGSFQQTRYVPSSESETIELEKLFDAYGNPFPYKSMSLYRLYQSWLGGGIGSSDRFYFKIEPIRWDVIDESDDSYLIMSHQALEWRWYILKSLKTGWESSDVRSYFNGLFLDHLRENGRLPEYILDTVNKNDFESCDILLTADNYKNEPGPTTDKVFLLSWEELGQLKDNGLFPNKLIFSEYASKQRRENSPDLYVEKMSHWFHTRSPYTQFPTDYRNLHWGLDPSRNKFISSAQTYIPIFPVMRVSKR